MDDNNQTTKGVTEPLTTCTEILKSDPNRSVTTLIKNNTTETIYYDPISGKTIQPTEGVIEQIEAIRKHLNRILGGNWKSIDGIAWDCDDGNRYIHSVLTRDQNGEYTGARLCLYYRDGRDPEWVRYGNFEHDK